MGAELGATTTVFPSDDEVRRFLASEDRGGDWRRARRRRRRRLRAHDEIDLSTLEPLIACPRAPGQRRAGARGRGQGDLPGLHRLVGQPGPAGLRRPGDDGRRAAGARRVSFDINPTSRQTLENLIQMGLLAETDARRGPAAPGRLQRLHRHGAGARDGPHQPAHGAAQLPRPLGHARRTRSTCAARRRRLPRPSPA